MRLDFPVNPPAASVLSCKIRDTPSGQCAHLHPIERAQRALNATPRGQFEQQRRGAKRRGIEFLLTFEEWLNVWQDSGRFHERGKRPGQYVMARRGDAGPYVLGNVYVTTIEQNTRDAFANGRHR
ncbi:MAG: hypothetical protein R3E75_08145 [Steroidobacteraceae bacterium]|nr:hypothetical protein [Nevskiaceae bacterium]MCP5359884.1 hypothetical protein [Nevskiaceae bacterium]MCP5472296.1 hypothetical protein [Nevskiaceae bacterium]